MGAQSGTAHQSLSKHLTQRRKHLRLAQSEAARLAGVRRNAWWVWEKGRGLPYDYNHPGIETAMQWEPGSVQAILAGDEPTEKPPPSVTPLDPNTFVPPQPGADPDLRDEIEREMWGMTVVSGEVRAFYINQRRQRLRPDTNRARDTG